MYRFYTCRTKGLTRGVLSWLGFQVGGAGQLRWTAGVTRAADESYKGKGFLSLSRFEFLVLVVVLVLLSHALVSADATTPALPNVKKHDGWGQNKDEALDYSQLSVV